jgi:putative redox protein
MDIIAILRKKRQDITAYEIHVHGERTEEYPRVFVEITIEHIFTGHAVQSAAVERAIQLTEERYCGASAILGKTAKLTHTFRIIEAGATSASTTPS